MRGRIDITLISGTFVAGCIMGGTVASTPCPALFLAACICTAGFTLIAAFSGNRMLFAAAFLSLGIISSQVGGVSDSNFKETASHLKESASQELRNITGKGFEKEGGILAAIAIGDRTFIDKALKADFKKSGAMHLVAISGLHVGVLYLLLNTSLLFLGRRKWGAFIRKLTVLSTLWFYAAITGMSSSITRAAIMISVYEAGETSGSRRNLLRALAISALLTSIYNPCAPFQIGFQLSYGAMASIHLVFPRINKLLVCKSAILSRIWDTVSLSISCQIFTSLLVWFYFGTFPKYFMITNLLAIPLTSICIYLAPVALITRNLPWVGDLSIWLLSHTLHLMCSIIHIIAGL